VHKICACAEIARICLAAEQIQGAQPHSAAEPPPWAAAKLTYRKASADELKIAARINI